MEIIIAILIFGVLPPVIAYFSCWLDDRQEEREKKVENDEHLYRQYNNLVKERWERKLNQM